MASEKPKRYFYSRVLDCPFNQFFNIKNDNAQAAHRIAIADIMKYRSPTGRKAVVLYISRKGMTRMVLR